MPDAAKIDKALEGITLLDEASRPKAPVIPDVTLAQRARGRRLGIIHRHHLEELAAVRHALASFLSGEGTIEVVADGLASTSMMANYRAFGTLCGRQCQLLQMHHDIEEASLYPTLRQNGGLRPVLDRLSAEHEMVHALLLRIRNTCETIASSPTPEVVLALGELYVIFERIVVSHFGYEERELEDALGYYNVI